VRKLVRWSTLGAAAAIIGLVGMSCADPPTEVTFPNLDSSPSDSVPNVPMLDWSGIGIATGGPDPDDECDNETAFEDCEPSSGSGSSGCKSYIAWSSPYPAWGPYHIIDEVWIDRGYTITASPVANVTLYGKVKYYSIHGWAEKEFMHGTHFIVKGGGMSNVSVSFRSMPTGSSVNGQLCW
jgi:hypothetical protein